MSVEELLKDRYKVTEPYPEMERHNLRVGDIITTSDNPMYADKTQDGNPVVAIDHEIFPANFKRLFWWEERDIKDMPEYLKSGAGVYKVIGHYSSSSMCLLKLKEFEIEFFYSTTLPVTEQEYQEYKSKNK